MSDVDTIKSRLDIADVISEYVPLKPAGANLKARCPFHEEKTPSFMVHKGKQIFRCFGCGEGGDIFTFLQKIENIEFPEALQILAQKAGIQLQAYDRQHESLKTRLKDITSRAVRFYEQILWSDQGQAALNYLKQERGLTDETLREFRVGLAPAAWDHLLKHFTAKGLSPQDITKAGLLIESQKIGAPNRYYDRFRDRIMFPIQDAHGQAVGFSGRLTPEPVNKPGSDGPADSLRSHGAGKYINTPETPIYQKARLLYGLPQAKAAIKENGASILVEGQLDVLASHQAQVKHVVAGSGTALTQEQFQLLSRLAPTVIFALDTDQAGEQAMLRAIRLAWQHELEIRVIALPQKYEDPADLVKQDTKAWAQIATRPKPFMDYYLQLLLQRYPKTTRENRKTIAKLIIPLLADTPDPIDRAHYISRLADSLDVDESFIKEAVSQVQTKQKHRPASTDRDYNSVGPPVKPVRSESSLERLSGLTLAIATKHPELLPTVVSQIEPAELKSTKYGNFYAELVLWYNNLAKPGSPVNPAEPSPASPSGSPPDVANIKFPKPSKHTQTQASDLYTNLELLADQELGSLSSASASDELRRIIKLLKRESLTSQLRRIASQMKQAEADADATKLGRLTELFATLTQKLRGYE